MRTQTDQPRFFCTERQEAACDAGFVVEVLDACTPEDGASPLSSQHLFNVITHPKVDFPGASCSCLPQAVPSVGKRWYRGHG
jgi:hypothetical protein